MLEALLITLGYFTLFFIVATIIKNNSIIDIRRCFFKNETIEKKVMMELLGICLQFPLFSAIN
jgi:hypothetical protein